MADFDIDGLKELAERLASALHERVIPAVTQELSAFAEEVMADSKQIVPVSPQGGNLLTSGHVDAPVTEGSVVTVALGYGGPAAPYALYVHEALEGPHEINPNWSWAKKGHIDWTRPGSGPKYLERPYDAKKESLPERLAKAVEGVI